MSRARTERLLNLTIALLATRRYLRRDEIRAMVPGYAESDEAFERAFERDKEDLREMGVPIETGTSSPLFDDEVGYRIRREAYAMPEVRLTREEMAVLALAAQAWSEAALAAPAARAIRKLAADNPDQAEALGVLVPRIDTRDPAFVPLWEAVRDGRPVSFPYRSGHADQPTVRTVQPWGVLAWHGHWYVVGHDRARAATRVFRLSRITGPIRPGGPAGSVVRPEGVDLRAVLDSYVDSTPTGTASLRIRSGAGTGLRRLATASTPAGPAGDGEDLVTVPYTDLRDLAEDVAALGPDAVAVSPPQLRALVVERLTGARQAHA